MFCSLEINVLPGKRTLPRLYFVFLHTTVPSSGTGCFTAYSLNQHFIWAVLLRRSFDHCFLTGRCCINFKEFKCRIEHTVSVPTWKLTGGKTVRVHNLITQPHIWQASSSSTVNIWSSAVSLTTAALRMWWPWLTTTKAKREKTRNEVKEEKGMWGKERQQTDHSAFYIDFKFCYVVIAKILHSVSQLNAADRRIKNMKSSHSIWVYFRIRAVLLNIVNPFRMCFPMAST